MEDKDLFQFYEKLYFHEIDTREKLSARLQTPLTLIISLIGVLAFLVQNYGHRGFSDAAILFVCLVVLSAFALVRAIFCFIRSWHNNTYRFLPSAQKTEDYRQLLNSTYESYDKGKEVASEYFHSYLKDYFIRCSSENTECNDRRSIWLHRTNTALIATAVIVSLAFLAFFFGDLDKANIKKITEVSVITPVTITGGNMSDQPKSDQPQKMAMPKTPPPPPPPPPPPLRLIREGVEVSTEFYNPVPPRGKTDGK